MYIIQQTMSDNNRKNISTQLSERMTPESHKTTGEKIKEGFTNAVDKVKAILTPDSEKSVDKVRGEADKTNTDHSI